MKTLFTLTVVLVSLVGCSAPVGHTPTSAMDACVYVCERTAECLSGYPAHGRTCQEVCAESTHASTVDHSHFCEYTTEIDHFVSCQTCLLGDTGNHTCDFSAQFVPGSPCYDVCQPTAADRDFCGCTGNPC